MKVDVVICYHYLVPFLNDENYSFVLDTFPWLLFIFIFLSILQYKELMYMHIPYPWGNSTSFGKGVINYLAWGDSTGFGKGTIEFSG
jgi:hypothetical protein